MAMPPEEKAVNEKEQSEAYYTDLAEHQSKGDANEANAEGTIFPNPEPIERTGRYAERVGGRDEGPK